MNSRPLFHYIIALCLGLSAQGCAHHETDGHEDHDDHEETTHHDLSEIVLSHEQVHNFGIEFEIVEPGDFQEVIKTGGIIEPSNSDLYTVTAHKSGLIKLADGITTGAVIKKGSRIAIISPDGIEGGDVAAAAIANLDAAKAEYERLKPLYEDKLVTTSTFREAERAYEEAKAIAGNKNQKGPIVETSPSDGTVTNLFVSPGQYVEAGNPIATVAKNTRMTLRADLPSRFSSRINEIETANFIPAGADSALSLREFDGKKISGSQGMSSTGGYIPVYFSFAGNPLSHPGGYADVFLLGNPKQGIISLPKSAVMELQGNKYVYILRHGHAYEKIPVETGADNGQRIEIKKGLNPGDTVVAKGATIVRMVEVSAVAPPSHSHNH